MKFIDSADKAKREAKARLRDQHGLNSHDPDCRAEFAYSPTTFAVGMRWHETQRFLVFNIYYPMHGQDEAVRDWISVGIARLKKGSRSR